MDKERERRNRDESDIRIIDLDDVDPENIDMDDIEMEDVDMYDIDVDNDMEDIGMEDIDSNWLLYLHETRLPATQCFYGGL